MNTDTTIGNRLALIVPKLCLGTHYSKLCFTEGRVPWKGPLKEPK